MAGDIPCARLQRAELAVPATSAKFFGKAAASNADAIFIDLEDAVAPDRKEEARAAAVQALSAIDWRNKLMAVRVNDLRTQWGFRDIVEMAGKCPRLDLILLPKTGCAADVYVVETLLSAVEQEHRRHRPVGIECLIETAEGLKNVDEIAAASRRLEALIFGVADFALSMGARDELTGGPNPLYRMISSRSVDSAGERPRHWADPWHFALCKIATACRANGLRAIDGPFTDFGDPEGYVASAERGAALGFEGKWAIHPSQIDLANAVFSPQEQEVHWAREVVSRMESSVGQGAIAIDGRLIDLAHLKRARTILDRQDVIEAQSAGALDRAPTHLFVRVADSAPNQIDQAIRCRRQASALQIDDAYLAF